MNIEFVGRHVAVEERHRKVAAEKLGKLAKFLAPPIDVQVELEAEKRRVTADLHLRHRHGELHAREESHDLAEALTLAIAALEKQAQRSRKRAVDRRRRSARAGADAHWPLAVVAGESLRSGESPRIIRSSRLEIKPMTIDEAALALESSKHEFVVFLDSESDRVSVLYKRRDENYGLIAPEF